MLDVIDDSVFIPEEMIFSEAFNDLNKPSISMLLHLFFGTDSPDMRYSVFKGDPFNMHNTTVTRSIDSLLAHGFMSVKKQGGSTKGDKTVFEQSDRWIDWKNGDIIFQRLEYVPPESNKVTFPEGTACLCCGETRGIQRAHIIPRRYGGVEVMPLCPSCHWYYDHDLMRVQELARVKAWVSCNYPNLLGSIAIH